MSRRRKGWIILGIDLTGIVLTFLAAQMLFAMKPMGAELILESLPYLIAMLPVAIGMSVY